MSGWNLSEGKFVKEHLSEDEIWFILNKIFSPKTNKTTTYKFCFLKSLLDNIFNVNDQLVLDLDKIFLSFAEIYWNLVAKYGLRQVRQNSQWKKSSVENIIENFLIKYDLDGDFAFENLKDEFQLDLTKKIGAECSKYVIGAFFKDTKESFYSFSKKDKIIIFNSDVYIMLVKYKSIIDKLNYYEWIKFLEKVNPNESAYALADKLDYSSKRNNLTKYRDFLLSINNQCNCFYCEMKINKTVCEVDHYIPWSFVKDDKLWNFVLSCRDCNNKKSDKLPIDLFTTKIVNRNNKLHTKFNHHIVYKDFIGYNDTKIIAMYKSAEFNGFENGWKPLFKD